MLYESCYSKQFSDEYLEDGKNAISCAYILILSSSCYSHREIALVISPSSIRIWIFLFSFFNNISSILLSVVHYLKKLQKRFVRCTPSITIAQSSRRLLSIDLVIFSPPLDAIVIEAFFARNSNNRCA